MQVKLPPVEVGVGARVVQALYVSSEPLSALAWIASDAKSDRVVALSVVPTENWRPSSLRRERLADETALVEQTEGECGLPEGGALMPRLVVPAEATARLPPSKPDDCASRIERVWMRRGSIFQMVGAYPLSGRQWLRSELVRQFQGTSTFNGDRIQVADRVTWYWFTGKSRLARLNRDFVLELKAEASLESPRTFRFDSDTLRDVRADAGPIPPPGPPEENWIVTDYGVGDVCSVALRAPRRAP